MTLYLITGPPAAGKTTYVKEHAKHGDIVIDHDALASVLTVDCDPHDPPNHIKQVVKAARRAAIDVAIQHSQTVDVYVIHSMPSANLVNHYLAHDAQIVTIDPGQDVVLQRVKRMRPRQMIVAAQQWYETRRERHGDDQPVTALGRPSETW